MRTSTLVGPDGISSGPSSRGIVHTFAALTAACFTSLLFKLVQNEQGIACVAHGKILVVKSLADEEFTVVPFFNEVGYQQVHVRSKCTISLWNTINKLGFQ